MLKKLLRWFVLTVALGLLGVWLREPLFGIANSAPPAAAAISFTGVLKPFAEVDLAPRIEGQIVSINVKKGDRVQKGDLVARLDYESREVAYQQAQLLLEDNYDLDSAELAYQQAHRDLARYQRLAKEKIESSQVLEQYQLAFGRAELNRKRQKLQARLKVLAARAHKIELDKTRVVAPISGIVAELYLEEGEMALVYGRYPEKPAVAKIVDIDKLILSVPVDTRYVAQVRKGQRLPIQLELFAGQSFTAAVDFISPMVDGPSDTVMVELTLDNPEHRLRPGMQAKLLLGTSG